MMRQSLLSRNCRIVLACMVFVALSFVAAPAGASGYECHCDEYGNGVCTYWDDEGKTTGYMLYKC